WVTPYQRHFLKFPLTLHDRDLPPNVEDARANLRLFVDEVMANAPQFPSHIGHSQWEYHWARFHDARRLSSRIRVSLQAMRKRIARPVIHLSTCCAQIILRAKSIAKQRTLELCRLFGIAVGHRYINPALRRFGFEIVKSRTLFEIRTHAMEQTEQATRLKKQQLADRQSIAELKEKIADLSNVATEYQFKLERNYDYQSIMVQDQLRVGMSNLEPEFLALYEQCRQYTMTSWERLYALYK